MVETDKDAVGLWWRLTKMLWDHGGDSDQDAVGLWWRQ